MSSLCTFWENRLSWADRSRSAQLLGSGWKLVRVPFPLIQQQTSSKMNVRGGAGIRSKQPDHRGSLMGNPEAVAWHVLRLGAEIAVGEGKGKGGGQGAKVVFGRGGGDAKIHHSFAIHIQIKLRRLCLYDTFYTH